jgi:hypothetical protein
MKTTYFLSNRKDKSGIQLQRQLELYFMRKAIPLDAQIKIEISESMIYQTDLNTIKITIN